MKALWNKYRQKRFERLHAAHEAELGVRWSFRFREGWGPFGDHLYFGSFCRRGERYWNDAGLTPAPKGNGAIALREFCELCDRFGLAAQLFTNFRELDPYYKRFGFLPFGMGNWRKLRPHQEVKYHRFAQELAK